MSPMRPVRLLVLLLATALTACDGPVVLLSGGRLEGETQPVPDDWGFTNDVSTVQLETRPEDPYSVNLWLTEADGQLYVHAGASRSEWVEHLEADPRARLRVENAIYELAAERVTDQDEFDRFAAAYGEKYGVSPRHDVVAEVYLYRLEAR